MTRRPHRELCWLMNRPRARQAGGDVGLGSRERVWDTLGQSDSRANRVLSEVHRLVVTRTPRAEHLSGVGILGCPLARGSLTGAWNGGVLADRIVLERSTETLKGARCQRLFCKRWFLPIMYT